MNFEKGEEVAKRSTLILLAISALKVVVGFISGSLALLAGGIDSFSDVFSSITVWAGLKIAKKKPTERFPYGYYKAETFALLIVSMMIVVSSIFIMLESWQGLFSDNRVSFSNLSLIVAVLSAFVYYLLAKYKQKAGQEIGSQALISEGLHSMIDVYTSVLVFVGVFFGAFGYQFVEALIGLAISLYVLVRGLLFGKDAALVLMDVSPDLEKVKKMKEVATSVEGVEGAHGVRLRKSGSVFFGEIHVEMREGLSLEKAHVISELAEEKIKDEFKDLASIVVHVGLAHRKKIHVAIPIQEDNELNSSISPHFGNAPYFCILELEEGQIVSFDITENKGANLEHKKGLEAARLLIAKNVDILLTFELGEAPFYMLKNKLVQIYVLPKLNEVGKAIEMYNQKLLDKLETPKEKRQ